MEITVVDQVEVKRGWIPPHLSDWVLVTVAKDLATGSGSVAHGDGATFFCPPTDADIAGAIARATEWAEKHGLPTVHIMRADDA